MKTSKITAIAHALPTNCVTQSQLEERFGEKAVKSITKMSGIRERRVVFPGQCASDLAFAAAKRLLEHIKIDLFSVDLLIFVSQTPDYRIPATSSVLHGRLGLSENCCTFDINQACSSFIHALQVAHSMIVAGTAKRALVLNGDALSTLIHPMDRGLVTLHGDAGTAALIEAAESGCGGIEYIEIGTDGTKFDRLLVPAGGARMPGSQETKIEKTDEDGCIRTLEQLYMDGPAIFHFVVYKITDLLKNALIKQQRTIDDFDMVLLHQANKTMVDLIYRALSVPPEKRFYYMEEVGNSSGASLPSLLAEAWREGVIKPGSRTLLCAFGGGLSWGVVVVKWPDDADAAVPGVVDVLFPSIDEAE
ncbi:MAG: ketoacyl-ACP synthase III [Chlorobiaceae bacterium]|nr:ketoacyl-ACP synthase III [Chlorobiaceae bacterium]